MTIPGWHAFYAQPNNATAKKSSLFPIIAVCAGVFILIIAGTVGGIFAFKKLKTLDPVVIGGAAVLLLIIGVVVFLVIRSGNGGKKKEAEVDDKIYEAGLFFLYNCHQR